MQLYILLPAAQPRDCRSHFVDTGQGAANIHKENMLGAKLVAYVAHLPDPCTTQFMSSPYQTVDVIISRPPRQCFGIDSQHRIAVTHWHAVLAKRHAAIP